MKKLLFVVSDMRIGGIQKSLFNLLKRISGEYEIALFCSNLDGEYLSDVPKEIAVLDEDIYAKISEISIADCKRLGFRYAFLRAALSFWSHLFGKRLPAAFLTKKICFLGKYDAAISYAQPINERRFSSLTNEIVLKCCQAEKKITFLHCDFGEYGGNSPYNRSLYHHFDMIAAVSESVGNRFSDINPTLRDKVITVYHVFDELRIRFLADESPVSYSRFSLVTVARLSKEKGLLRCIPIFSKLKQEGFLFEWYLIGEGDCRLELVKSIQKYGLEREIILVGEQKNPYRYMKKANYFFLPSVHEAAPMVFGEAACLGIPILTTRTLSADELVRDNGIGIVCDNNSGAIYEMLKGVMDKGL